MLPQLGLPVLLCLLAGCPGVQLHRAALLQLISLVSQRQLGDNHPLNLSISKIQCQFETLIFITKFLLSPHA